MTDDTQIETAAPEPSQKKSKQTRMASEDKWGTKVIGKGFFILPRCCCEHSGACRLVPPSWPY